MPVPGGFSYYEAKSLLLAVCARCNVLGFDLVEVSPPYDGPGQVTAIHGARLILDAVGAVFRRRSPDPDAEPTPRTADVA